MSAHADREGRGKVEKGGGRKREQREEVQKRLAGSGGNEGVKTAAL
ncbi:MULTISPECIES: hypothetical protein [Streptomyces]